jgi:hypothetical protein
VLRRTRLVPLPLVPRLSSNPTDGSMCVRVVVNNTLPVQCAKGFLAGEHRARESQENHDDDQNDRRV